MTNNTRLKSTIYVGGLDHSVTKDILHSAFIPFGEVVDVSIPRPDVAAPGETHRGFGYVEFELPHDAKEAIDNMDQSELFGRVIKVAQAKPQKEENERLGSKTAVWEQVSSDCFAIVDKLTAHRRAGWQGMVLARSRKLSRKLVSPLEILCKVWIGWMLQDLGQSDQAV